MTGPHATMIGIFHCPLIYIAHETGLGEKGASKGLQGLIDGGFCDYDYPSETVFVYRMAAYQVGERLSPKDKRIKGIEKALLKSPNALFSKRFVEIYGGPYQLSITPDDLSPIEAPSKPHRSQEQEQEQEQEHSDTGVSDACASISQNWLEETLWKQGLLVLSRLAGKSDRQCRSVIGKWRKDHADEKVLYAIARAEKESASEPVAFVEAILRGSSRKAPRFEEQSDRAVEAFVNG